MIIIIITQTNKAAAAFFGLPMLTYIRQLDRENNGLADMLLHADENLVDRVLNNLLKNAVETIRQGSDGWVEVWGFLNEREDVVLEICDSGGPILPAVEERIFIPFFTTKKEGSGIGLSISRQIMRLSGGTLTLRTRSNTTFVMTFGG